MGIGRKRLVTSCPPAQVNMSARNDFGESVGRGNVLSGQGSHRALFEPSVSVHWCRCAGARPPAWKDQNLPSESVCRPGNRLPPTPSQGALGGREKDALMRIFSWST